jgi:hypothetical protein
MILQAAFHVGIKKGDSIAAGDMFVKKFAEVSFIDEVRRNKDDIIGMDILEENFVFNDISDIGVVGRVGDIWLIIEDFKSTTFGVRDPATAIADMLGKRTDMVLAENTHIQNARVEEVRKREIDKRITT